MTNTTAAAKLAIRTATGTVHNLTVGRTYKQRGETLTNSANSVIGRADCGAQTSSAATFATEAVNCPKCIARS